MITTVRAGKKYYPQTIKSLEYSSNARSIQNDPFINTHIDTGLNMKSVDVDRMLQVFYYNYYYYYYFILNLKNRI